MKQFTTLLFFLLLGINTSFSQVDKEMLKYHKTGTYEYKDGSGFIVKRTKGKQVEYNKTENKKLIFKVKWVSDDTYHLIFKKHKNYPSNYKKGDVMVVKIISAYKAEYTCLWELKGVKGELILYRK